MEKYIPWCAAIVCGVCACVCVMRQVVDHSYVRVMCTLYGSINNTRSVHSLDFCVYIIMLCLCFVNFFVVYT